MTRLQRAFAEMEAALDARGAARLRAREEIDRHFAALIWKRAQELDSARDEAVAWQGL